MPNLRLLPTSARCALRDGLLARRGGLRRIFGILSDDVLVRAVLRQHVALRDQRAPHVAGQGKINFNRGCNGESVTDEILKFVNCCAADSQTKENQNQLNNNLKIDELEDFVSPC